MEYRKLGRTDLDVSLICLGSMTWGEQNTPEEGMAQMDMARELGVNFFDVAEMYPVPPKPETAGESERVMGDWLKKRGCREELVIATKVTGRADRNRGMSHIRNGCRLDESNIRQALEDSLKRLQTDYVDLYQVHWPERSTNFFGRLEYEHQDDDGISIEETLDALDSIVREGKVRHIGISNESAWGVAEYLRLSREKNQARIASIQNPYNLLNRSFDVGLAEFAIREGVSSLVYSPLAFGALSGKYLNGARPAGARLTLYDRFTRYFKVNCEEAIQAYVDLAQNHELDPSQMALAWVNQRQSVTSNIVGATSLEQLEVNIKSADLKLDEEVLADIEAIHQRYPNPAP